MSALALGEQGNLADSFAASLLECGIRRSRYSMAKVGSDDPWGPRHVRAGRAIAPFNASMGPRQANNAWRRPDLIGDRAHFARPRSRVGPIFLDGCANRKFLQLGMTECTPLSDAGSAAY
ncbi:hypothetical protein N7523_002134 [Penicillium sp. IBT 18751x]|nr:hypothetical protein N7523_002134 [Penicillium sp. IBT 18751x]